MKEAGNPGCPQPGVLETPSDRGGWRTTKNRRLRVSRIWCCGGRHWCTLRDRKSVV